MARVTCCLPFCKCYTDRFKEDTGGEWICPKHWRNVRRRTKRMLRLAHRKYERAGPFWHQPAGTEERFRAVRAYRQLHRIWGRCKAEAIERMAGF